MLEAIKEYPELEERIISPKEAMKRKKESSLLVMVDYHKPSLSISQELYERFDKVVIIDHHRRGDEFPAKPLLSYIESSASSASELVTELIEYQSNSANKLQAFEATMMLAGIVVDTKVSIHERRREHLMWLLFTNLWSRLIFSTISIKF